MPNFTPTPEQEAIRDFARKRTGSAMVNAFAGCAKTTTLELAAGEIKFPALALAFNKKIADDMKKKLPSNFTVKTFNGLGHQAWSRVAQSATITLDDRKLGKLVTQVSKDRKVNLNSDQWDSCRRLVSNAMLNGLVPASSGSPGLLPDEKEIWLDLADNIGLWPDEAEFLLDIARNVLEEDIKLARAGIISFDDQVYCSTMLGGRFPAFPIVFVDEAQDLNGLNHLMFQQSTRSDGRAFIVGDPHQSIYAFRGATNDSMGKMKSFRRNDSWTDLPLNITFRCPKVVVSRQQEHVPGYRAWHTNAEGMFTRLGPKGRFDPDSPDEVGWTTKDLLGLRPSLGSSLAVLCRNTAPLLSLAFKLIRQGIGVVMMGRDIGKGLVTLSRKLAPEDATPSDQFRGLVLDWQTRETSLAIANDKPERVARITDQAECLLAVMDGAEAKDAGQVRALLAKLFDREHGQLTLGTIHRAKGLEWDVVVHLDPWRLPSRQAKKALANGDPLPMQQELNLRYVCETRTKHTLATADLEAFQ